MLGSLRSPSHPVASSLRSSQQGKPGFFRRAEPKPRASIAGRRFDRDGNTWATQQRDPIWRERPTGLVIGCLERLAELDACGAAGRLRSVLLRQAGHGLRVVRRDAPRDVIHALNLAVAADFPRYRADLEDAAR